MSDNRPPNFADPRNVIHTGRKDSLATWMAFYGMLEDTTDRYTTRSDWAKAPADEAFIHAAIRLRALSAASVPLRVYVRSGHDLTPADLTEDKDAKELQELLDFVNPDTMSSSDLKATLVSSLSIYGEAYLLKTRGRLGGRPKELHFLNPAAVTPKVGDRWIDEYVYQPVGRQQTATYDPKDVIAFRVPGNFIDPTRGLSPINAVRMEIGTSRMATEHTNSQLRNQGVPAGVWVAPKDSEITTQDQSTIKRVLASLRGPKNAGKTAVLPGGLEWRSLGFSEKDAQYLMARKVSRMAIGAALGVPLALLGDDEHTGVYRSTRDAEQVFWRRLTEELNWMAQIIDSWLTSEYDKTGQRLTVRFDTSAVEALRPTIMEQSSLWQMMLSMGIVTTNEARAHFGVGAPVEWGNVPVRSGGLAPIGTDGMPVMPAAPAAPGAPAPEGPKPAEGKEPAVIDAMTPEDESDDPEVQPVTPTVSSWQGFGGSSQSGLPKGKKHGDHDQTDHGNRDGAGGGGQATITQDQYDTVAAYTRNGYRSLNETLRTGTRDEVSDELESERVKVLDGLIAKGTLEKETVVYRGVKLDDDQRWAFGNYTDWSSVRVGDVLQDEGYMSTAKSRSEAEKFLSFGAHSGQPIMFEIKIPAGLPALDVSALMKGFESKNEGPSFYPYESEILLPRDSRLEITDKSTDDYGRMVISATVISSPVKSLKHADHDQADHGNRDGAGGGGDPVTPGERSEASAARRPTTRRGITPEALSAVEKYAHGKTENDKWTAREWNEGLRSGKIKLGSDKEIDALAKLANENVIVEETTFYRGSFALVDPDQIEEIYDDPSTLRIPGVSNNGQTTQAGFTSLSEAEWMAREFARGKFDDQQEIEDSGKALVGILWHITAPAGARGVSLKELSGSFGLESETILPPGTQIDWNDVEFEGDETGGTVIVYGEIVVNDPVKYYVAIKHGDHDQGDHGNRDGAGGGSDSSSPTAGSRGGSMGYRATAAIESAGGRVKSMDFDSDNAAIEKFQEQVEETYVAMLPDMDDPDNIPEDHDPRIASGIEHMGQALMDQGTPGAKITIIQDKDGNIAGAGSSTLMQHPDGYEAVLLTVFGTNGLVPGAGSAIISRLIGEAFENDQGFVITAAEPEAWEFYERVGLGAPQKNEGGGSATFLLTPDQVGEWIASYVAEEEGM